MMRRLLLALALCLIGHGAFAATTWNPSDNSDLTLSGGNLTAASKTTANQWQGVRSTNSPAKTAGKWHVECTSGAITENGQWDWGFADSSETLTNTMVGQTAHSIGFILSSALHIFQNNVLINSITLSWSSGDVVELEVDIPNNLVWFQDITKSSGWSNGSNNTFTGNPGTGTGGITFTATTTGGLMSMFSSFLDTGFPSFFPACTINPTTATGTVSSGFKIWDATAATPSLLLLGVGQ